LARISSIFFPLYYYYKKVNTLGSKDPES